MDNQHQKIKGYRDLTQEEIDGMNEVKEIGVQLETLINKIAAIPETDKRWLSIGATDLQKGTMALTRAIARPTTF